MTYAELINHVARIVYTLLILAHLYIAWLIYKAYIIEFGTTRRKRRSRKRGK